MTIPTLNISDLAEVLQTVFLIFFPNYAMALVLLNNRRNFNFKF